jgi:uncharacterized protein with FMN-binding domain
MPPSESNKKVANGLVTLSSAAILAVYAAGFMKTRAAAEQMEEASNQRRPTMPAPATAGEMAMAPPIEPTTDVAKPTEALSPALPIPPSAKLKPTRPATLKKAAAAVVVAPPVATPEPAPPVAAVAAPGPVSSVPPEPAEPTAPPLPRPKEIYKDGTYLGWGTSRHGDIQAQVKIEDGRITTAIIAQCWTRYSCSWVAHLPPQVVARQSPNVDWVGGATESANAFYWAVVEALNKAK